MAKSDKIKTSLRKLPRQRRSEELVDSVLEAATRILDSVGLSSVSTNKIAAKAGVSIGSLYQYFPSKDAIFARLIERQMDRNARRFQKIVDDNAGKSARQITDALISDVVDLFFERRFLFASLFAEVPRLKKTREVLVRRNKTHQVFIQFFRSQRSQLREPDRVEEMVYVFSHGIVGVLQTAALENFESHTPEVLKRNLQDMASNFMFRD